MIRSSRGGIVSRSILIAAAAALVPLIAGCEAGTNAPTLQWHQPTDGTHAQVSRNITVNNAFVLGAAHRRGAEAGPQRGALPRPSSTPDRGTG